MRLDVALPRWFLITIFLVLALDGCAGGGDDEGGGNNDAAANGEVNVTFNQAYLVWAFDDAPLGATLNYSEGIEQQRLDSGVVVVLEFGTTGDVRWISPSLVISISFDGQEVQGPLRTVLSPDDQFEVIEQERGFDLRLDLSQPLSPVYLNRLHQRLLDEDVSEAQRLISDIGEDNRLDAEVTIFGDISVDSALAISDFTTTINLDIREDEIVDLGLNLDLGATCPTLLEQQLTLLDQAMADLGTSLNARQFAMEDLSSAAEDRGCENSEFQDVICAHSLEVQGSGADASLQRVAVAERFCGNPRFSSGHGMMLVAPADEYETSGHQITFEFDEWTSEGQSTQNGYSLTLEHPDIIGSTISFVAQSGLDFESHTGIYLDDAGVDRTVDGHRAQRGIGTDGIEWVTTIIELDAHYFLRITAEAGFGDDLSIADLTEMVDRIEESINIIEFG